MTAKHCISAKLLATLLITSCLCALCLAFIPVRSRELKVASSDYILRCTAGVEVGGKTDVQIVRIIYGDPATNIDELQKRLAPMEGLETGMGLILFVREPYSGTHLLLSGIVYGRSPVNLDDEEREIIDVLRKNGHMSPAVGMRELVYASETIVRAGLLDVSDGKSRWKVSKVLYVGPPWHHAAFNHIPPEMGREGEESDIPSDPVNVSLDKWRLRAATLARYDASGKPGDASPEDVQKEYDALVRAELVPGNDAILFLAMSQTIDGEPLYAMQGIIPADAAKPDALDTWTASIIKTVKTANPNMIFL